MLARSLRRFQVRSVCLVALVYSKSLGFSNAILANPFSSYARTTSTKHVKHVTSSPSNDDSDNTKVIAGATSGGIVAILLILAFIIYRYRKRRLQRQSVDSVKSWEKAELPGDVLSRDSPHPDAPVLPEVTLGGAELDISQMNELEPNSNNELGSEERYEIGNGYRDSIDAHELPDNKSKWVYELEASSKEPHLQELEDEKYAPNVQALDTE